jgi:ketosteroid isomerase-like protein
MSQENVERYRRSLDAWNRGARDEWLEDITAGWEFVTSGTFPGLDRTIEDARGRSNCGMR